MAKVKECVAVNPDNFPKWYWTYGLHDACITEIKSIDFPFNYNKFIEEKNKYNRNCLSLKIDSRNAMYDNSIKEIRFYNYKMLTDCDLLSGKKEIWWFADRLFEQDSSFILQIDLRYFDLHPKMLTIKIKFERAEVDRELPDTLT